MPLFFTHAGDPIKILLVPGHDDETWGAQHGYVKEAAMNLAVGRRIYDTLKKDKRFEVHITRQLGGYTKEFEDYFSLQEDEISLFRESAKAEMKKKVDEGKFIVKENVPHNTASEDVALRLYGFNKWANENKIDAVIHIHFNDYPRTQSWKAGKYRGFAIYMPDNQFGNSFQSGELAVSIFTQLEKKYITSTYEKEKGGLVSDQKLIALGANNTLLGSVRSVLIEYGYIYSLGNSAGRHKKYNDMATLSVAGIKNYFFPKP